jgi:hypothetical protein
MSPSTSAAFAKAANGLALVMFRELATTPQSRFLQRFNEPRANTLRGAVTGRSFLRFGCVDPPTSSERMPAH